MITHLPPAGHVGYVVSDLERAIDEAAKLTGLKELKKSVFEFVPTRCWAWGKEIKDCRLKIAMVDWTDQLKIEFIQTISGDIHYSRFLKETGGGMHHTAHYVEDYPAYRAYLLSVGAEIIFETETEDCRGYRRSCHVTFPDSCMNVEVLEIAKFK